MSAIVKTQTPFVNKEFLLKALQELGVSCTLRGEDIITNRVDYGGAQTFLLQNGRYTLRHDTANYFRNNSPAKSFINALEVEYKKEQQRVHEQIIQRELELERIRKEKRKTELQAKERQRLEEQRLAQQSYREREKKLAQELKVLEEKAKQQELQKYREKQKQEVYKKAEKAGYKVKEIQKGERIQLVLVRRS